MTRILVACTKGGCGKTTIATNLSTLFLASGKTTLLCDADRQRSSLRWAKRRPGGARGVETANWSKEIGPLNGAERVVIDAPAAMTRGHIDALVRMADVIVVPVAPSFFDEAATQRFLNKLEDMKRVKKAKAVVLLVGNRVRRGTRAADRLEETMAGHGLTLVTRIRDAQMYPNLAEDGLGLFDLTTKRAIELTQDWVPVLSRIEAAA